MAPSASRGSNVGAWLVFGALVVTLFVVGRCSSSDTPAGVTVDRAAAGKAQQAIAAAVQAQSPPAVKKLSRSAVRRGLSHVQLATKEGLAGEMIYSQNCYDALGRTFSWFKLDACGAFDAEAALELDENQPTEQGAETAWLDNEAAAGRFLKAAEAAGASTDEADTRWSELQARVASKHKVKAPPPNSPTPAAESPNELDQDELLVNVAV